jgi:hypothetical protein
MNVARGDQLMTAYSTSPEPRSAPLVIRVFAGAVDSDEAVQALIDETRSEADAFIFLVGGASRMSDNTQSQLLGLLDALAILARRGPRIAVGDGGTESGLMKAAGLARRASNNAFPLIGIAPAREIPPEGSTAVDPNHSAIIAVDNPDWDGTDGFWGAETTSMYRIFARLAEDRPSATIVASGGDIALTEVEENVRARRPMVVIAGSGRAADTLVSSIERRSPADAEIAVLRAKADKGQLTRRPALLHVFEIDRSADELANVLSNLLTDPP